ncbi:hypothetical protein [Silvanigrella sp.]|jgi:hypothetical protein|uniref:hypothetical protein n=1 Tax=Silvanigrella sp. TaxID=2024976 RepID=UPI0037C9ECFA|nr:hypothetical protein [Silvanigrellaceae bacterium]
MIKLSFSSMIYFSVYAGQFSKNSKDNNVIVNFYPEIIRSQTICTKYGCLQTKGIKTGLISGDKICVSLNAGYNPLYWGIYKDFLFEVIDEEELSEINFWGSFHSPRFNYSKSIRMTNYKLTDIHISCYEFNFSNEKIFLTN